MTDKNDPAMPRQAAEVCGGIAVGCLGLTAIEHAAIALRVPKSGTLWLDAMIRQSRVLDLSGYLMAGWVTNPDSRTLPLHKEVDEWRAEIRAADAAAALSMARDLLAESEKEK